MRTIKFLVGLSLTLVFCIGTVMAQMDPGTGSAPRNSKPRVPSTTATDTEKSAQKKADLPAAETSEANSEIKSVEQSTPADPLAPLHEQIGSAANGQEKGRLQLELVDKLMAAGKKAKAINELHRIVNEDRFDPQGFYNAGNALARLGDSNRAVTAYRKAIEQRKGRYSKALNNLGVVLMRQGNWSQASEALTRALRLENFRYAEASYNLGRLYATQGEMDLAIREWRRAVYVDPGHGAAKHALAQAGKEDLITISTPPDDKAFGISDSRLPIEAAGSSRLNRSGERIRSGGLLRTASSAKTLTLDPVTYSYLQRARNARERGKDDEAVQNYRAVISRAGGYFGPANLELSYVLIGLQQQEEAASYLREVTARDGSRYPISFYHLGRIYEFRGNLELAEQAYGQAARYYADANPQFLLDISRVREKRRDYTGALGAMQEYLKAMESRGIKLDWSEERLAFLKQKVAAAPK